MKAKKTKKNILKVFDKRVRQIMEMIAKCDESLSEDNVHHFRTKTRRINFMINVFNKYIKNNNHQIKEIADMLKPVFKSFGELRDLQLQIIYLNELDLTDKKAVNYINELNTKKLEAEKNARENFDKLDSKLLEDRLAIFRNELAELFSSKKKIKKISTKLNNDAQKIYNSVDKKVKKLELNNSNTFHKLRIKFKKLRYTLEVLKPIYGFKKKYFKKLVAVQDELGDIQDIQVRIDEMQRFAEDDNQKLIELIEKDEALIRSKMNDFYNNKSKIKKLWEEIN